MGETLATPTQGGSTIPASAIRVRSFHLDFNDACNNYPAVKIPGVTPVGSLPSRSGCNGRILF